MKVRAQQVLLISVVICAGMMLTWALGCSEDAPPDDGEPANQQEDVGSEVSGDAEDATEDAEEDVEEPEMRETGEPCPDECVHQAGTVSFCDYCEEGRCMIPPDPDEEAYCTWECETDEDCEEKDGECYISGCMFERE